MSEDSCTSEPARPAVEEPPGVAERAASATDSAPVLAAVEAAPPRRWRRRKKLPAILFALTCLSTFWAGAAAWLPMDNLEQCLNLADATPFRRAVVRGWQDGLIYMGCVLAILLAHETGHFLATVRYRIPASLPFFLPFPISPFGTMGAVIVMDGRQADRRQMFDIGLAGPLGGLLVAVPVLWLGIRQLDFGGPEYGPFALGLPLGLRWVLPVAAPDAGTADALWYSQANPYFMAGWVGLFITGLNMLPVGQLDGGHVVYALFGRAAHWVSRGFMLATLVYISLDFDKRWPWSVMAVLLLLLGIHHPPTSNDAAPLGRFRIALGIASLAIPVLCFPLDPLRITDGGLN